MLSPKKEKWLEDPKKKKLSRIELKGILDAQVKKNEAAETPTSVKQGMYIDNKSKTARLLKEKEKYFNPEVKNISSRDKKLDLLYKNQWLMNVPVIGDYIKGKAKDIAKASQGDDVVGNIDETLKNRGEYRGGSLWEDSKPREISLIDQYFSKKPVLENSSYKPTSDYLEFLPSYSLKNKDFDSSVNKEELDYNVQYAIQDIFQNKDDSYEEFINNKQTRYETYSQSSPLSNILNADLGGHKTGLAWDKDLNLPYVSISDAWDFAPEHYSSKYGDENIADKNNNVKNQAYIQSSLMHKAGNPFKIYDRFYFDPKTKQYISDEEIKKQSGEKKYKKNWLDNQQ